MLVQHKQISLIGEVWQLPGALAAVPAIGVVVGARRHFVVATDALRQFRPETFAGFHLFQFQNINQSIKSFEGAEMRKGFSQGGGWGGEKEGKNLQNPRKESCRLEGCWLHRQLGFQSTAKTFDSTARVQLLGRLFV